MKTSHMAAGLGALLLATTAFYMTYRSVAGTERDEGAHLVTLPPAGTSSTRARTSPTIGFATKPPPVLAGALKLSGTAVMREQISEDRMKGIVCSEVSPSGDAKDFRRFVYNGSGGTGAIDDGTKTFRKFADKICLMGRGR